MPTTFTEVFASPRRSSMHPEAHTELVSEMNDNDVLNSERLTMGHT